MYGTELGKMPLGGVGLPPPMPGPGPGPGPAAAPPPPGLAMPPPPAAIPSLAAEQIHRRKQDQFVHAAIADFHRGGITRTQLADAIAANDAYDYKAWKESNVIHPSQNSPSHNEMPPDVPPINPAPSPPAGMTATSAL